MALSPIDEMERLYFTEYEKLVAKDKGSGKDFNSRAYDELRQAKYHFEYLRTQEKFYQYEQQKQNIMKAVQT